MKGKYSNILFIFIINFIITVTIISAQNLTIVHADGSVHANLLTTKFKHNIRYISINDFANLFNARTYFNVKNKKVTVNLGEKVIEVSAFNPFFLIDNVIYQLPLETEYKNQEIYLPMTYFLKIIERTFPDQIIYKKNNDILKILNPLSRGVINISNIQIEEKANGTLIKIVTTKNFNQSDLSLRARHRWLYLDIYGGKIDSTKLSAKYEEGVVSRIVPSQISNELTQIGFRLRDEIVEKHFFLTNPKEILISIKTKKDLSKEITQTLEYEKKKWRIDKIVIDPGHGGRDPGAPGFNKTYEKRIVLAVAKYLKEIIVNESNIEVLMTREKDRFVELKKRAEFANENQAKLFISVHANANDNRRVRGVSTYFLGPERTEEARKVALLENSVIKYESGSKYADLSGENFILSAMAQNIFNAESQDWAAITQQEIIKQTGLRDAGVRQAGFYVLLGASMPNILVEIGFLSNRQEEILLNQKSFQKKIARGIFNSIKKFKEKYELEL
ncbi:MAG: N-acetylmuramoyl-L-alanine amidase family protein [Promethearchaeota archaeon]